MCQLFSRQGSSALDVVHDYGRRTLVRYIFPCCSLAREPLTEVPVWLVDFLFVNAITGVSIELNACPAWSSGSSIIGLQESQTELG